MRVRVKRPEEPLRVLFVCTANVSRSPYAERRAVHLTGTQASTVGIRASSAGVDGLPGQGMDPAMAKELAARGVYSQGHLSRAVTAALLEEADVVVTVEMAHRLRITQTWPEYSPKVFGLRQLADAISRAQATAGGLAALDAALAVAQSDSLAWDVVDPYKRGRAAARACANEIDDALAVIIPGLSGRPHPAGALMARWSSAQ